MLNAQSSKLIQAALLGLLLAGLTAACAGSAEPTATPAPTASDQLSMTRGPCFGACPMYTVTVWGDGRVVFDGNQFVAATGEHTKTVDPAVAAALFARADSIDFFDMPQQVTPANDAACGQYHTDAPSADITIVWGSRDHTVSHYHGCLEAPEGLRAFEDRIDAVLGLAEWIGRR